MTALFRVFQHHDQQRPGTSLLKCLAESNRARLRRDAPFSGVAAIHLRHQAQASGVKPASRNMGQGRRIFSKKKRYYIIIKECYTKPAPSIMVQRQRAPSCFSSCPHVPMAPKFQPPFAFGHRGDFCVYGLMQITCHQEQVCTLPCA